MGRLLLTGVTGFIGQSVARVAGAHGWSVNGLARGQKSDVVGDVTPFWGDLTDADLVKRAMQGCDAVLHLGGFAHRSTRTQEAKDELRRTTVTGSEVVASAARVEGCRLVFASSIAVYGPSPPAGADESTPLAPTTPYGEAKRDAEDCVRAILPTAVLLRISTVYGPESPGVLPELFRWAARGLAVVVGDGQNRKSMVYIDNLVDRIMLLLARPALQGAFIATDPDAPSQRMLVEQICKALGRRPPLRLPAAPLRIGVRVADRLVPSGRLGAWNGFSGALDRLTSSTEFSGRALDKALSYTPRIDFTEGIRRSVDAYKRK